MSNKAVIVDYVRTPFTKAIPPGIPGKTPGQLADMHPAHMFGFLLESLVDRTGVSIEDIKTVIGGCVHQEADQGLNIARMSVLSLAEKDATWKNVPAFSVDHFCGSSATTIGMGKSFIADGTFDLLIAGGVQSMSRVPMGGINSTIPKEVYDGNAKNFMNMGVTAENLNDIYGNTREEQDRFSLDSHAKFAAAVEAGHYDDEIATINGVSKDDSVRTDSTLDGLAKLRPVFKKDGSVTPASSSPITDGASAVLMASEDFAKANNLPILSEVFAYHTTGCAPEVMGLGPVETIKGLLKKADLSIDDIDAFEINEAFAGQFLGVAKELAKQGLPLAEEKVNVDGGAIALGHPLAASGARLAGHLSHVMNRLNLEWGIATMCIGGGQGAGVLLKNPNYDPAKPKLTV